MKLIDIQSFINFEYKWVGLKVDMKRTFLALDALFNLILHSSRKSDIIVFSETKHKCLNI
ncbi:uncharacterized protein CHSO_1982 [Chryseobacterium sp. StRB126]|nr:uncharacterized protein CHSO_1982 [Chryseobacterium sp. StRB126]